MLKAHRLTAEINERLVRARDFGLFKGAIVALRLTKEERRQEGKMSPLFQGPYEVVRVLPTGVSAEIRCAVTGTVHTVNRTRLKILQAPPEHFPAVFGLCRPQLR